MRPQSRFVVTAIQRARHTRPAADLGKTPRRNGSSTSAISIELHQNDISLRGVDLFLTYSRRIGAKRVAPLAVYRAGHIVVAHEQSNFS